MDLHINPSISIITFSPSSYFSAKHTISAKWNRILIKHIWLPSLLHTTKKQHGTHITKPISTLRYNMYVKSKANIDKPRILYPAFIPCKPCWSILHSWYNVHIITYIWIKSRSKCIWTKVTNTSGCVHVTCSSFQCLFQLGNLFKTNHQLLAYIFTLFPPLYQTNHQLPSYIFTLFPPLYQTNHQLPSYIFTLFPPLYQTNHQLPS